MCFRKLLSLFYVTLTVLCTLFNARCFSHGIFISLRPITVMLSVSNSFFDKSLGHQFRCVQAMLQVRYLRITQILSGQSTRMFYRVCFWRYAAMRNVLLPSESTESPVQLRSPSQHKNSDFLCHVFSTQFCNEFMSFTENWDFSSRNSGTTLTVIRVHCHHLLILISQQISCNLLSQPTPEQFFLHCFSCSDWHLHCTNALNITHALSHIFIIED